MIAEILECPFYLNILDDGIPTEKSHIRTEERQEAKVQEEAPSSAVAAQEPACGATERDITIGELVDIHEELDAMKEEQGPAEEAVQEETAYEEAAQEEPVYEEPAYEEPAYEEPAYEEPAYEEPVYEESAYEEAASEEPEAYEEPEDAMEPEAHEEAGTKNVEPATEQSQERKEKKHSWRDYLPRRKKKTEEVRPEETESAERKDISEEELVYEESSEERSDEEPVYEEWDEEAFSEAEYEEEPEEAVMEAEPEEAEAVQEEEEDLEKGDVNPYTGREYQSNSVRMHPTRIGYVQVYDRGNHQWTDMTEWAFLGYQERKKALLGKDYDPPIYLD